jgi:hypothetical protein
MPAARTAGLVLAVCSAALAQRSRAVAYPELAGAVAVDVEVGPAQADRVPIILQLRNLSKKAIYGLGYDVSVSYADGSIENGRHLGTDLLGGYIYAKLGIRTAPAFPLFRPDETFTLRAAMTFPLDRNSAPPVGTEAAVTAIVFEDRTALGSPEDVQHVFASRARSAAISSAVVESLKLILQADDPAKAAEKRAQDFIAGRIRDKEGNPQGLLVTYDAQGREVSRSDMRGAIAQGIRNAVGGIGSDNALIRARLAIEQQQLDLLKQQLTRAEVGQ